MHGKMRLLHANLLDILKQPEFDGFLDGFHFRKVEKGTLLCQPGDEAPADPCDLDPDRDSAVFIVVSGRLRVFLSYEGREFTLSLLEQGDVFSSHTRTFIEAAAYSELMVADLRLFREKLLAYPQFSFVMVAILGHVLRNSLDIIESLVFHDVGQRLAEFLAGVAEEKGIAAGGGIAITMGLHTEDLGRLIGASRQTTSHLLNDLIRRGLISRIDGKSWLIRDLPALQRLATGHRDPAKPPPAPGD